MAYKLTVPPEATCQPEEATANISIPYCLDNYPLQFMRCKGYCDSHSALDISDPSLGGLSIAVNVEEQCRCCKPVETVVRSFLIMCTTGSYKAIRYTDAVSCKCSDCPSLFP